ncbi:MAG: ribonuclease HII [Gammaproteobacteria bacterium]|nr:ribonuclease HII [Gammaproteobacteria bacterium]
MATTIENDRIAGVDEAGRGALAGPVVAAAVILNPERPIAGLRDSKQLSAQQRERLFDEISAHAMAYSIGRASIDEIDELNIFHASLLAMQRAVLALTLPPHQVMVDGTHTLNIDYPCQAIIKGDQRLKMISAASILAKVTRDREMQQLDNQYPGYYLASHKGYGTKVHLAALKQLGATVIHRQTFAPVRAAANKEHR